MTSIAPNKNSNPLPPKEDNRLLREVAAKFLIGAACVLAPFKS